MSQSLFCINPNNSSERSHMPVFTKGDSNTLYIHVPKTGGSTIEGLFIRSGYEISFIRSKHSPIFKVINSSPQHYHSEIINSIFDLEKFDFKFMTVRNPVQRLISEFFMRCNETDDFNSWTKWVFKEFTKNPYIYDNHIRPQHDFHVPGCEVYRQEDRFDDVWIDNLNARLRHPIKKLHLERLKNKRGHRFEVRDETLLEIRNFYDEDFKFFNYDI